MRLLLLATMMLLLMTFAMTAGAAKSDPSYNNFLNTTSPDTLLSVIVRLNSPRDISVLDQELHFRGATRADRHRIVVHALQANAAETQGPVREKLDLWKQQGRVIGYTTYWIENLFVVYGTASIINNLKNDPAIYSIEPNFSAKLMEPVVRGPLRVTQTNSLDEVTTAGQDAIGATRVNRELGITGQGVIVANCDTGVDWDHPALTTHFRGRPGHAPMSECWRDYSSMYPDAPGDDEGHGSHVMGTICGREIQTDGDTITVGAAPNAEFICTNPLMAGGGESFDNFIISAFQWLTDPDGDSTTFDDCPDVVQNSWGVYSWYPEYGPCYSNWNNAILNCEAAGTIVIWSAGNDGPNGSTIGIPPVFAFNPTQIFCVGAVDATNSQAPYPIADFSSRGPSTCPPHEGDFKPEVVAPGVDVFSVGANTNGYVQQGWGGTSMSGPHVAGVAALMREACPNCDPQTIKEIILQTATDAGYPPAGDDNTFGMGLVNAYAAVEEALLEAATGYIDGIVGDGNGHVLSGVQVHCIAENPVAYTNNLGYYCLRARPGIHTIEFSKFGYDTTAIANVSTTPHDTTEVTIGMSALPSGNINGVVQLATGYPLSNSTLIVQGTPLDTMHTDSAGHFSIDLPVASYVFHVERSFLHPLPTLYATDTTITVATGVSPPLVLTMQVPMVSPAGPDAYGYRAYDNLDSGLTVTDEWVEIDPAQGGQGLPFVYSHHDSAVFLATPFPLFFYGATFDSLTVNNNGWMLPGIHHGSGQNNTQLPHVDVNEPRGIIAPYWDNFRVGADAHQWSWYDEANGRWILEFVNERLVSPNNVYISWQVHFYNPALHPTVTGDGDIVFVYGRSGYFSWCTVGIERLDQAVGLQINYCDLLHANSFAIDSGSTIRFTTGRLTGSKEPNPSVLPAGFALEQNFPNPFNPVTHIRLAISDACVGQLRIYDVNGRLVRTLVEGRFDRGYHDYTWDGTGRLHQPVAAGMYFYRFDSERFSQTRKMLLLK